MTERFFFTDPLAAAWMAKHFGMSFTYTAKNGGCHELGPDCFAGSMRWYARNVERFYVHPDSLHLLEPLESDRISFPQGIMIFSGLESDRKKLAVKQCWQIIQRNGVTFMWPECEAA